MKKKDLKVIIPVIVLAAALFVASQVMPRENKQANAGALATSIAQTGTPAPTATALAEVTATPAPEATDTPAPQASPETTASPAVLAKPSPVPTLVPAKAYLKVQIGYLVFEPLALTEERDLELTQPDGKQNVVRITPESIIMHSSNCDNQDCVHQGMVSLENRDKRVLQSMIICLPNQVVLELLDPEEAQADWEAAHEKPGA